VNTTKCDECGNDYRVGDWPWCGGGGEHRPGRYGFEPFRDYVDEHILEGGTDVGLNGAGEVVRGTRITSREQRRAIMRANKIEFGGRRYGRSKGVMF